MSACLLDTSLRCGTLAHIVPQASYRGAGRQRNVEALRRCGGGLVRRTALARVRRARLLQ